MTATPYTHSLEYMNEIHDRSENLVGEKKVFEAAVLLIEDGQTGLAYRIVTMEPKETFTPAQKFDLIRLFSDNVDEEHAKRLSSRWLISKRLPEDIRARFRRKD